MNKAYFNTDKFGKLYLDEILLFYDTPLTFVCKDEVGKIFLANCIRLTKPFHEWMLLPITKERLEAAYRREMDFKTVFTNNEEGVWIFTDRPEDEVSILEDFEFTDDILPTEGYYL